MKNNQHGFSALAVFVVIVIVGLIGAIGWLVYDRQNSKSADKTDTNAVKQDRDDATTADENRGYLVISEWGLRFTVPDGLSDVKVGLSGDTVAIFAKPTGSSVEYVGDYYEFKDNNFTHALGVLYRSTSSTKARMDSNVAGKKIGDYYYYTNWAFSGLSTGASCVGLYAQNPSDADCAIENTAFALVNQGETALLNTIEKAE